jgi:cyanophycinase
MKEKGKLMIIGGNEDKGIDTSEQDHLEFISDSILANLVEESGGAKALIAVLPTASRIPDQVSGNYMEAFRRLGCENVHIIDIRKREDAENPDFIQFIKKADCVMMSGGNQSEITRKIGGTVIHETLSDRYKNDRLVIAGTSAGAMCMANEMIAGGGGKEFFNKGSVKMGEGLALIPELIIDSHFIRRGRFGRLAEAIARFPDKIGIGLAENTAVIIKEGKYCKVLGSGMVIIFDAKELEINDEREVKTGEAMTLSNLKVHVLSPGYKFDIEERNIEVIPVY